MQTGIINKGRKLISLFLILCMMFGMVSTSVLAKGSDTESVAEETTTSQTTEETTREPETIPDASEESKETEASGDESGESAQAEAEELPASTGTRAMGNVISLAAHDRAGLQAAINGAGSTQTTIIISQNFSFDGTPVSIPANADITIQSTAGSNFILTQSKSNIRHFTVNGTLTLLDITLDGSIGGSAQCGGVLVNNGGNFTMGENAVIQNCRAYNTWYAGKYGGGVGVDGGTFTMKVNAVIQNCISTSSLATYERGGGVHVYGGGVFTMNDDAVIQNCRAGSSVNNANVNSGGSGGGVALGNAQITGDGGNTFTMNNNASIQDCRARNGGGVELYGMLSNTLTLNDSAAIKNCNAIVSGGGVHVLTGTVKMNGGEISGNKAVNRTSGSGNGTSGGGVDMSRAAFFMSGGVISGNLAFKGGGVNMDNYSEFTMDGGAISGNTAADGDGNESNNGQDSEGGGVLLRLSTFEMNTGEISSNTSYTGGGVFMKYGYGNEFTMNGGEIHHNKAMQGGGVNIYDNNNTLTINGGKIRNNTAESAGGGIYFNMNEPGTIGGKVIQIDGSISGNTAKVGGGIYMGGGTVEMNGGEISGNAATDSGGGVWMSMNTRFNKPGTLEMSGGEISGNTALNNGGGAYVSSGANLDVSGYSRITNNAANLDGGGIFTADSTYSNLKTGAATIFDGNTAQALYNYTGSGYPDIGFKSVSVQGTHALNNYDINYKVGSPLTLHTVTFESNGGSAVDSISNVLWGSIITAPADPTRSNYTFDGWYTDDGIFADKWNFDADVVTRDITLYAKWTADQYTVTYHANGATGGTAPTDNVSYLYGATVTLLGFGSLERSGYTFTGWNTAADGNGTAYAAGSSITITDDVTLHAQWTANTYDITYESLNGASNSNPATYTYSVGVSSFADPGTRTHYTFEGWYDAETGGNEVTSISDTTTGDKTLYAIWTADSHTVTYKANGGTGSDHVENTTYDANYTVAVLSGTGISRTGYTFTGWNTQANGSGTAYAAGDFVTISSDMALYAQWSVNTYNITYKNLKGASNSNPAAYTYGNGFTLADPGTRMGYTFDGWYDAATNGSQVTAISNTATGDKTLYARWILNICTITVKVVDTDGNSISGYDWTVNKGYGETFGASAPTIQGYTYQYWKLDGTQESGDIKIASVEAAATVTLVYQKQTANTTDTDTDNGNYQFVKVPNVKNVKAGETIKYTFTGFGNDWGVPLEQFSIIDKPDKGLDFVSANLPAFTNGAGVTYDVLYYTNQQGRTVLHSDIPADQAFSFNAPDLASGEYIIDIMLEFSSVPAGFAVGDSLAMTFKVWDNPPSQTLVNVGILSYKVNGKYKEFVTGSGSCAITISGYFGSPKTGDETNFIVPLLMLLGSISGFIAIPAIKRRRRRTEAQQ